MSGRTKTILYRVFIDGLLWVAAIGAIALLLLFTVPKEEPETAEYIVCGALVLCVLLRMTVLLHELGHLIFGLFAGMKAVSFTVSFLRFSRAGVKFIGYSDAAGATEMFPKSGKNVRRRVLVFALGGTVFNILLGGLFLGLYLGLPYSPALLFFGLLGPLSIYEGIRAIVPANLPAGKTDGAVVLGIIKNAPEERLMLRVFEAQGILYRGSFSEIPRTLLFVNPVVREDLPAFHALLFLRMQFLLNAGEKGDARRVFVRLQSLSEYLPEEAQEELSRYEEVFNGTFSANKKEPLRGVRELEQKLVEDGNFRQ